MTNNFFAINYHNILDKVNEIDPVEYAKTRNYTTGAVTQLSPYISRGVIALTQVLDTVLANGYSVEQSEKLIQELAWREYFQRVWQFLEDDIFKDIRIRYKGIQHKQMSTAINNAATGIAAIDNGIENLYKTGYLHNHLRMYIASIACNVGKAHWQMPAQWMYYHLLDGDLASNICSWQWVAGTFSSKQYYCNQENINKYTGSHQQETFLDKGYDELPEMPVPHVLSDINKLELTTILPDKREITVDPTLPVLLYNSYNLDPNWRAETTANRVLILEPSHFKKFPVSKKVIDFILALSKNIDGLQVFVGEASEIPNINIVPTVYSKEHPAFKYYPGHKDERDWLFPEVTGMHNSFFSYWKKCQRFLKKKESRQIRLAMAV